jgi:hypothetical protein
MTTTPINLVNTGTAANDGTGATIRSAFQTVNNNFSYLTGYSIASATDNIVLDATAGVRKFVANASGTLSNVWISLPVTAADGQEMFITSMVPITSCYVNQNGNPIMWLSNTFFSTGNVTAHLTYTTSTNRWMTF